MPFADLKKVIDELLPELVSQSDTTVPRSTAQSRRAMTEEDKKTNIVVAMYNKQTLHLCVNVEHFYST